MLIFRDTSRQTWALPGVKESSLGVILTCHSVVGEGPQPGESRPCSVIAHHPQLSQQLNEEGLPSAWPQGCLIL